MVNRILMAGVYFHQKYPGSIIFYRLGEYYTAFQDDAERAASILRRKINTDNSNISYLQITRSEFLDAVEALALCGISAKGLVFRDDNGNLTVPDVSDLLEETEMDY